MCHCASNIVFLSLVSRCTCGESSKSPVLPIYPTICVNLPSQLLDEELDS